MQKTILVIGATGLLGQSVARCLKESGFQVRVMTRDRQKARQVFDDAFEIAAGDPMDTRCLEEALNGCYGVHISLPTEVEQQVAEAVAKAAPRHEVQRISYISGATVAEKNCWFPMVKRKFLAEKALRDGDTPSTIFCPTWVMESLPLFVVQGRATVLGRQPYPYHWVAAEDCAQMVSNAYHLREAADKRFIIHGPEAISMKEALGRYCARFHPELKKVSQMPIWLVKTLATVTRNQGLKGVGEMMAYFDKVGEMGNPAEANQMLGAPQITLDTWLARRNARIA